MTQESADAAADDGARRLPIRGARGAGVFAVVDAADYERLKGFRWYLNTDGYVFRKVRNADGKRTSRLLVYDLLDRRPDYEVDHEDRDRLNNRRGNLRYATRGQNVRNSLRDNATGFRGVSRARRGARSFVAQLSVGGRQFALGTYRTAAEAARVHDAYVRRFCPAFGVLNFPEGPEWTVEEAEYVRLAQARSKANPGRAPYERIAAFLQTQGAT